MNAPRERRRPAGMFRTIFMELTGETRALPGKSPVYGDAGVTKR